MAVPMALQATLDELVRDMDLLVFRIERAPDATAEGLLRERVTVRRELEELRDRLERLVQDL